MAFAATHRVLTSVLNVNAVCTAACRIIWSRVPFLCIHLAGPKKVARKHTNDMVGDDDNHIELQIASAA